MAKIVILGAGVMGSAFSHLAANIGHEVCLVGTHLDNDLIEGIHMNRVHRRLRVSLPESVAAYTFDQLGQALDARTDLIVLGVSSAGIEWATAMLGAHLKYPLPIMLLTKGLTVRDNSVEILPTIVREGLEAAGLKTIAVGAMGGPCIAGELAVCRQSSAIIAFANQHVLNDIDHLFIAPYFHAPATTDIVGVEVCAALKNFYAIAVAYPAGQLEKEGQSETGACMHNHSAGLFTQALAEMKQVVEYMGGNPTTVYGLAGTGDLYVTCQAGRNSRMGRLLGTGLQYSEAKRIHMAEETVEGAELALSIGPALGQLMDQGQLNRSELPLMRAIIDAICNDRSLQIPLGLFYR